MCCLARNFIIIIIMFFIMFYYAIMAAKHTVQYTHIWSYTQIHPLKKHKKIFKNS